MLLGTQDFRRFREGDILVCRATDPAWTPLFRYAAGIITETGGTLSHAAIVAREVGIPAVLAVPDATTHYVDGTRLTVDGTTGRIEGAVEQAEVVDAVRACFAVERPGASTEQESSE